MKRAEERAQKILSLLLKRYPDAKIALNYKTPLDLLVATILAAQCTDKRVNQVTESLFKKYKTPEDYAKAGILPLEQEIRSTGFYHNKARNIIASSRKILLEFGGQIPQTMKELITLPGVARKTANIVLFNCFGKTEGIAVDTHVIRVSQRLGFTMNKSQDKIEKDLMSLYHPEDWGKINYTLIEHGKKTCVAFKPKCPQCVVGKLCPSKKDFYPPFSSRQGLVKEI